MRNFFNENYIFDFIWFLIGAFVLFLCSQTWNFMSGPKQVKLLFDKNMKPDTTVTIIKIEPKDALSLTNHIKDLTGSIERLDKRQITSIISSIITNEYQKKLQVDSGLLEVEKDISFASLNRPRFKMPSVVSGFTKDQMNSYSKASIESQILKQNENIKINLEFFHSEILSKITPVFVEIVKKRSENSSYLIWSDQFQPENLKTLIKFSADFPRGKYELTISFYFKSGIHTKYPKRYARRFNIEIV